MNSPRRTILLIEDEPAIAETIVYALHTEGFATHWAQLAQNGFAILKTEPIDLVILDVGLPDQNGFEAIRTIQTLTGAPVIFLTARASEVDRIVGLEIGADDYVVKPFSPRELTARVKAVLRRKHRTSEASPQDPEIFRIDIQKCQIYYFGQLLDLSRCEYEILKVLLAKPGHVFSRDRLLDLAWTDPLSSQDRTIDSHIKNIRQVLRAIRDDVEPIQTHRGLGYSLKESF